VVSANLVEIFSSVQGEGTHVGESTIFVRFGGCDLRCAWCDSPHTWRPARECRFERRRGTGKFDRVANPVTVDAVIAAVDALEPEAHRFVSLTGGEPLLQATSVLTLARALRDRGPRIHLETHGLAVEALEKVIDAVDVVSMDWKLASDVRRASDSPERVAGDFHGAHVEFLRTARRASEVLVKVVVTAATGDEELVEMGRRIAAIDPKTCVILQPVTPLAQEIRCASVERLLGWVAKLSESLSDVRLIPQTHRSYGAP
jgi:organic radical activating enzyme